MGMLIKNYEIIVAPLAIEEAINLLKIEQKGDPAISSMFSFVIVFTVISA